MYLVFGESQMKETDERDRGKETWEKNERKEKERKLKRNRKIS